MPEPATKTSLLDEAIAVAAARGLVVRYDHLGGSGSGYCRVGEALWVVVDVAQPVDEQLDVVAEAIAASEPSGDLHCSEALLAHLERVSG